MSNFYTANGAALASNDDTWTTPLDFFNNLNKEFNFGLDAAALSTSTLVKDNWYGPDHHDATRRDALARNWSEDSNSKTIWLNPPYGRTLGLWTAKANQESNGGGGNSCAFSSSKNRYKLVVE
jgi:site-specific DNA-methyltransferase (adenine-specific)